jgi:hypothetical protein
VPGGTDHEIDEGNSIDIHSTPGPETNFTSALEDLVKQPETNSTSALEGLVKQNPYLGMISQEELESLQKNPDFAEVMAASDEFLNHCERQISDLAYMRSTVDAFLTAFSERNRTEVELKMLLAKSEFLVTELEGCFETDKQLMVKAQTLNRMLWDALSFAADGDMQQLQALESVWEAKNAALKDTMDAMEKTQARLDRTLALHRPNVD